MITKISFLLVVISGVIHPLWNMLLKKSEDKIVFYLNIHLIYTVLFSFILFIYPLRDITAMGWTLVMLSALTHFFYQVFLCKAYEIGDMSLMYPIVRSSPVFVVLMGMVFLKEMPSKMALLGIGVVIVGVHIINQKSLFFSELFGSFGRIRKNLITVACLTAFSSACYSVVDKKGVLAIEPILFFYLFFSISGFMFLCYLLFLRDSRKRYFELLRADKFKITLAAVLEFSSYILILYAFRISKIAYIVALRQISVVFGALYGIIFLKEKHSKVRLVGALIIFLGVFLITVFG